MRMHKPRNYIVDWANIRGFSVESDSTDDPDGWIVTQNAGHVFSGSWRECWVWLNAKYAKEK